MINILTKKYSETWTSTGAKESHQISEIKYISDQISF